VVRLDGLALEEHDYLYILSDIVEKYESEIDPEPDVPPHVMLRELIAFRGATQTELARATGIGESVLSELIRGKRKMGRKTIERLARFFHVDPALFFPPLRMTKPGAELMQLDPVRPLPPMVPVLVSELEARGDGVEHLGSERDVLRE
jgi:HTH-type transcriptional regulator/antitoxin HigA